MSGWRRVPDEWLTALWPNARVWDKDVADGVLRVIRTVERQTDERPWRTHVSVSHRGFDGEPDRYPTWDEQKACVWEFAPGKPMASFLPPEGDPYVNHHPTTFHWWETDMATLQEIR